MVKIISSDDGDDDDEVGVPGVLWSAEQPQGP